MASLRTHVILDRPADAAWRIVSDVGSLAAWLPGIASCRLDLSLRTVVLDNGREVVEEIVTNDPVLRRLQYRIVSGLRVESHLATVDILELTRATSLVVYSTEVSPDSLAAVLMPVLEQAVSAIACAVQSVGGESSLGAAV